MFELECRYATSKVFSDDVDSARISQVIQFSNQSRSVEIDFECLVNTIRTNISTVIKELFHIIS